MRAFRKGGFVPDQLPVLNDKVPDALPGLSDAEMIRIAQECAHCAGLNDGLQPAQWVLAAMRRAQRHPAILDMIDAGEEFVRRVENGEVRSQRTYARFKKALIALEG